jgi:hypothetical protein
LLKVAVVVARAFCRVKSASRPSIRSHGHPAQVEFPISRRAAAQSASAFSFANAKQIVPNPQLR